MSAIDIPTAGGEVDVDAVAELIRRHDPDLAVIERAGAMPKQGVSSTFKFGCGLRSELRAAVVALRVPLHVVPPSVWKRFYGLPWPKRRRVRSPSACGLASDISPARRIMAEAKPRLLAKYGADVILRGAS